MSNAFGGRSTPADALRRRGAVRAERSSRRRGVQQAVVSVAGLVGAPVANQAGEPVGKVVDLIARMQSEDPYPPLAGLLVRVGSRRSFLPAEAIGELTRGGVTLRTARLDLRDFLRRPGEVLLAGDVLDHQLIDLQGRQVLRAADLYLARMGSQFRLVGLDVGFASLLRRLGPRALRGRPTPERVIDWAAVAPFGDVTASPAAVHLRTNDEQLRRLAPADLADLLEDLARPARQELLDRLGPDAAADAMEEMEPEELEALLREAPREKAAVLVAAMEPDEAVDALRGHQPRRPHFELSSEFLLLGVALIGTTVSPYMQFYAAAGVVDRGVGPDNYRTARIDAVAGAIFACVISITIIIATGTAIGGRGPLDSAKEAAEALRPVAGEGAVVLFAIGLLGASALAGAVVPLSSSYAISEAVGVERSVSRRFTEAPLFLGIFTFQIILGAAVALTPVNLISLLIGTQVLQGLITPVVLVYILVLSNRRSLLGDAANSPAFRIAATTAVAAVSAMSLLLLGWTVLGWFGLT
jgi:hypothetical protein